MALDDRMVATLMYRKDTVGLAVLGDAASAQASS
jgi:hypothetical protein